MTAALSADKSQLRIICPFIKSGTLDRLLRGGPTNVKVITRFNLMDFANGVSDIASLRRILGVGGEIHGIRNLHAKLYLFGTSQAIVTSANLTEAALNHNHEFGVLSDDTPFVEACENYFEKIWKVEGTELTHEMLDDWEERVSAHLSAGGRPAPAPGLDDYGADAGIQDLPTPFVSTAVMDSKRAFVKFLGEGKRRVDLSLPVFQELYDSGCHWAVGYPATKRPRNVKEGDVMFISCLTNGPNDIRIFGKAIAREHVPGRDEATEEEIKDRTRKAVWRNYIRVHHAEFVDGTMENGVSLNELMDALGPSSFESTKTNAARGVGNVNPRNAYRQQASVQLSPEGKVWLTEKLELAFRIYGRLPAEEMAELDWPRLPS